MEMEKNFGKEYYKYREIVLMLIPRFGKWKWCMVAYS